MVEGTMTWTSSAREFGFFTPSDGSRDVFMRLSPLDFRCLTHDDRDRSPSDAVAMLRDRRDGGFGEHRLATKVEVRTRYQQGQWASGYEIAQVVDSGYRIRRPGSLEVLPEIVVPIDVRRAGDER